MKDCRKCPRLIHHCQTVAQIKRRAYQDEVYWGGPVPSFGPISAKLLILGLAPGAHGANRTGRVFTGDSSGNLLYRVLYQTGFASQPDALHRGDGMQLLDARITCAVHCAPPANQPHPQELQNCSDWLGRELNLMRHLRVVVALGRVAFDSYRRVTREHRAASFGHNVLCAAEAKPFLVASYHPSQQNTFTGKLTERMLVTVFEQARTLSNGGGTAV